MKKKWQLDSAGWVYVPLPVSCCGELAGERIDVVEQRMEHVGGAGSGAGGAAPTCRFCKDFSTSRSHETHEPVTKRVAEQTRTRAVIGGGWRQALHQGEDTM